MRKKKAAVTVKMVLVTRFWSPYSMGDFEIFPRAWEKARNRASRQFDFQLA
ncbi:hypothetical protein ACFQ4L_08505 [Lapidilactobacillus mulanensis]|uniref:Uncharacterized protein n=1 Tax=Lapidilactobacillus mulanensis TaxID=2485999 RepID=A0ABW4DRJ8_9LACO